MKTKWTLDGSHSEIQFKVKHLMITTVTGQFKDIKAEAETEDENFENTNVTFEAATTSVDTNNEQRDAHLRSGDFFDAEKYPQLKFVSKSFTKAGSGNFKLDGDLTIKDVTKPVTLDVEFGGIGKDPYGNVKAGFTVNGKINRKDFGLTWNAALESGGVMVSEDVKIHSEIQFIKQK